MIHSIEIIERFNSIVEIYSKVDFGGNLLQMKNNVITRNEEINIDFNELSNLIKKYTTYWDNYYIDNKIIGGNQTEIILNIDSEIVHFNFINKYPSNYDEFIQTFKEMVGIYE